MTPVQQPPKDGIVRSGRSLHRAPKVRTVLTMALGREIDQEVPGWVRLGLGVVLAIPQLAIGFWAVIAPENWYSRFPGFDPRLIAADPPFNEHLATDTGAGFLATGVALVVAALLGRRSGALVALAGYFAFAIPHAVFHSAHRHPVSTEVTTCSTPRCCGRTSHSPCCSPGARGRDARPRPGVEFALTR